MKHAYLILAHNEFGLLQALIDCIDDARNSIYVHIDAKVKTQPQLHASKASLKTIEHRTDIRWGDISMIEAEYALLEAAVTDGPFDYYHLLSGVDLPLKSQNYIHAFFEKNAGKEFIGFSQIDEKDLMRRMQLWHLFPRHFSRRRNGWSILRALCLRAQILLGIRRNKGIEFKKGSQWVSISDSFAKYVLSKKAWATKTFSHTFVPDECLMQTLAWNSPFRGSLYNTEDDAAGCMRAIGWRDGELRDWSAEDYETMKASPALFARKFNSNDKDFIRRICEIQSDSAGV